ncbi:uncharacterized protein LOC135375668 [Ornithodoros turicata]|uniref:uncharacterized protein LOC135375668 n=1 Tax=Ornithodoros turicata TaxID=34597 RepID=UPI0031394A2F
MCMMFVTVMLLRSRTAPTMFVTRSGGRIADFLEEVDQLPPSVRVVVLHCGTNDMPYSDPDSAIRHYVQLLDHIRSRGNIDLVVCTLILPRSFNRRRSYPDRRREFQCNPRAYGFNMRLRDLCKRSPDLYFLDHGFHRQPPTRVLAADGLHPNFEGVRQIADRVRTLLPRLLRRLPVHKEGGTGTPDPVWPTIQEAAASSRSHVHVQKTSKKQD